MRRGVGIFLIIVTSSPAFAQALEALVAEALDARTELAQANAETSAARERSAQVEALPEPMFQVGVQNDGFSRFQVGTMATSWVSFMASQTFPFPGKLGLRGEVAQVEVRLRELQVERVRLSTIAEVRRGYLSLQLTRARQALLEQRLALTSRLVEVARIRAESSEGTQAEVLRAQVELSRVGQRGLSLRNEAQLAVQALNRLRRQPLDTALQTTPLAASLPELLTEAQWLDLARAHSPEYLATQAGTARAEKSAALAERSYFPDITVAASLMVRGPLEPMWGVSVGVPLPVFAASRQARARGEAQAQGLSASHGREALEQRFALAAHQRAQTMGTLAALWSSYHAGLLAQAALAAQSTLAQYTSGRAMFSAVLEANATSLNEVEASLQVLADAWRLAIDQDELTAGESNALLGAAAAAPATSGM